MDVAPLPSPTPDITSPLGTNRVAMTTERRLLILGIALSNSIVWAVLCDLVLEMSTWTYDIWDEKHPWYVVFVSGPGLWLGSLVTWLFLLLLMAVTNRYWLSLGLGLALAVVVSAANHVKLQFRQEPLYPSDVDFLRSPRFLMAMVSPTSAAAMAALVLLILTVCWVVGRRLDRRFPRIRRKDAPRWWAGMAVVRLVTVVLISTTLLSAESFNQPGNAWKALYERQGATWRWWFQALNYRDNGFFGGLFYNMPVKAMVTPVGYDKAAMAEIADRYARRAERLNDGRTGSTDDVNIVLVLSEAFSDPTELNGFELPEDPLPRTRELMLGVISGEMLAQRYGGGTANMEFELLTGQSLGVFEPQLNTPYQMLLPDFADYPSAVGWIHAQGHQALAIHPYFTGMYQRNHVYRTFGFDGFVHDTTMQEAHKLENSEFISDESAFAEVLHQVENSDRPLLINLVTMQNHVPMEDFYDQPFPVTGVSEQQTRAIGAYARGLSYTDEALAEFLESLRGTGERSVVVFYGDHLPGLYDEHVRNANPGLALYRTPFFIWDSAGNLPRQEPLTSPTQFLPLVYEKLDAPIPPYFALLDRLRSEIPAMEQGKFVTRDGTVLAEDELSPKARRALEDYRMVQYDFSIGERYALDELWYSTP